jgi:1-acyl-sn-glycerol-3-phosphate acyltransferase
MLLWILRLATRLALRIFFREIEVRGRERVPADRALIFVANHPNVMLDSLILGVLAPGTPPRFLGKSTLFRNPISGWFLYRLGVIPVARSQDTGARKTRNRDMLREACQTLSEGGHLAMYPEGLSHPEPRVQSLKPGAARIALRAESESDGSARTCIVPVGLTYSDPGIFRSEVFVQFGDAISVAPLGPAYREDRNAAERDLTDQIHERLSALTRHIEEPDLESVISDLSAIYTKTVEVDVPDSVDFSRRLHAEQEIIRAVHYFAEIDPDLVNSVAARLRAHHRKLRRLRLSPRVSPHESPPVWKLLVSLVLLPVVLLGFVSNALPYYLPRWLARPYRGNPETVGTVKIAAGAMLFPVWYSASTATAYLLAGIHMAVLFGIALPVSGLVTLLFEERILRRWPMWQGLVRPRRRRYYLRRLSDDRAALMRELDVLRERYLSPPSAGS